ncbi:sulfite reductase (NADPH) flavoprotein alpha-component [Luteimonas cucumeris]|uniref:Sulfite reductase [NADPH] flavoprotein alpha-component n=1 Tax=Luteimonas cucumeris TaxID=985012 RepID=A0A562L2Q5_9GAMM|nr:assimilatory sulfite reductase (NADPH) flavoprotein subunit [Luteimonas cucumeris]TWI01913.1 sulfite reductase (NADPH) flavoprotein alpha-component [Luteimonas cucumeris]
MSSPAANLTPLRSDAPFPDGKADLLAQLTEGLDSERLWWLSGYAAGLARANTAPARALQLATQPAAASESATIAQLTIVYGSQTGNARRVAETLAQRLQDAGIAVRLLRADAYPTRELKQERYLYIVISTQGDGDPPDDARGLVEFITGRRAPALAQLNYAVLGLGDSSYPQFCAIGSRLDERLAELGATRLLERGDADLDIDTVATPWLGRALDIAADALKAQPLLATVTPLRATTASAIGSREHPYAAELLANQRIALGGDKDIRHIELSLADSGLRYEPGDALGLWPRNPPALVAAVLDHLALDGDEVVTHEGESLPLHAWLGGKRELTKLARPFVASHAARSGDAALQSLLAGDNATAFGRWLDGRQLIDLLRQHPGDWSGSELVQALRLLTPRLYSIASSQKAVGDEAHLTVAHVEYASADGELRWGAASHLLAASEEGATLPVYIERNERFRLPADATRDVIMIGPGTGVAPFRGFVQERAAIGAGGRNWLFFGNPHFRSDFLYQLEWQRALRSGQLHRLDLAFSRDAALVTGPHRDVRATTPRRTYVQQRLREQGRELYAWLEGGAHLYVCGAIAMGKDVHAALLDVIVEHGGRSIEDATEHLDVLQRQGRYARDVY